MAESPLIATKFVRPVHAELIARPRLNALLDSGAMQPLTLISAPPGFGKTMLVADWMQTRENASIAWLSLDEGDDHLHVFWRYFISALQSVQPGLAETARQLLAAPAPPAIETILATLINELVALPGALTLALDDYHQIQSLEIHNSLVFLLDHQPKNFHLIILTREDPPLGLARRRARRQMVEIRSSELRFSTAECAGFLQAVMGLTLSGEQVALLERATEGWIVGLQMAALSLRGSDRNGFFDAFSGGDRYITDYLLEEVLQIQPEAVRTFLLKTSILERMSDPLCAAVLGGTDVKLAELERSNLFVIPLDTSRTWYRYHHLFADLLRQRLVSAVPAEEIARLRRAASEWFKAKLDIQSAIRLARQIPDEERVAYLLGTYAGFFFFKNELPQFVEFARQLPDVLQVTNPQLNMALAWAFLATNHDPEQWLSNIERHFRLPADAALSEVDLEPGTRAALLEVILLRQQNALQEVDPKRRGRLLTIQEQLKRYDPDQVCLFNTVKSLQPVLSFDLGLDAEANGDVKSAAHSFREAINIARADRNFHILHFAIAHLANVQATQAQLYAARKTCEEALAELQAGSVSPYASVPQARLGSVYYEWGLLKAAEEHFQAGLAQAQLWSQWEALVLILCGLARIRRRRGESEAAFSLLDELEQTPIAGMRIIGDALRALWLAQDGALGQAEDWLKSSGLSADTPPTPLTEPLLLDIARLLLLVDRAEESLALAHAVAAAARPDGRDHLVIQALTVQACALAAQKNEKEALNCLREALTLGEPENYSSSFIDEGQPVRALLAKLLEHPFAARLFAATASGLEESGKRASAELLSEREMEVMRLIAGGLSNQQIADRLVISLPTVKTHVGNIYNKLGVANRTQAVARAEALGLILPG